MSITTKMLKLGSLLLAAQMGGHASPLDAAPFHPSRLGA